MQQAVGIFVDVSNIYSSIGRRYANRRLNYEKYLEQCQSYGPIYRALAYGLELSGEAVPFKVALRSIGFETRYKKLVSTSTEDLKKSSWNVGMAMDIIRLIDKLDVVIIGSNDAALSELVQFIVERGRRCVVFACSIQRELKELCNQYIEIKDDLMEVKISETTETTK